MRIGSPSLACGHAPCMHSIAFSFPAAIERGYSILASHDQKTAADAFGSKDTRCDRTIEDNRRTVKPTRGPRTHGPRPAHNMQSPQELPRRSVETSAR